MIANVTAQASKSFRETIATLTRKGLSMQISPIEGTTHGHHKVAAAVFVGSLVIGAAMILSAELMKPERYEFHPGSSAATYVIYDRHTGRASSVEFNSKTPTASLAN